MIHISLLLAALSIAGITNARPEEPWRMFAAVYLVRGSVSGGNVGSYGVFVRNGTDSTWTKITRSNMIAYGLALYRHGPTTRYYIAGGNGLHRSTDGGKTWKILTSWRTEEILCAVPDPVDSAVIYVGTPQGIFKTTDDGATWNRTMRGFKTWFVQKLILDVRDRRVLYATAEDDLYRTTDGGGQWNPLHVGVTAVQTVLQVPSAPLTLLVGAEDGGVRHSSDGGKTWKTGRGLERASVYVLSASPTGHDLFAAGWKTGIWKSQDGGSTWDRLWDCPYTDAIFSIFIDPADERHMLVGTVDAGIYESFDSGRTWARGGLFGAQIKQIEIYP